MSSLATEDWNIQRGKVTMVMIFNIYPCRKEMNCIMEGVRIEVILLTDSSPEVQLWNLVVGEGKDPDGNLEGKDEFLE